MEPYLPLRSKCARFCLSAATVVFWVTECFLHTHNLPNPATLNSLKCLCAPRQLCLIMACIIGVIAYRLAVYAAFASFITDPVKKIQLVGRFITPQLATSVTASCINFVIILILNFFYEMVAVWITDMGRLRKSEEAKRWSLFFFVDIKRSFQLFPICRDPKNPPRV